jgi:AcrR family transcriptional regulator
MAPAPDSKATRRLQPRGRARREAILAAAVRLFSQRGFRGTGITGLAREVGITHVGLLHHFGTKQQLLLDVVAQRDQAQAELIAHLRGLRGLQALRAVRLMGEDSVDDELHVRLFIVLIAENLQPDDPLNAYFRARYARVRQFVANAILTGQNDGDIRADANPEAIGAEVMSFVAGTNLHWLLDPDAVDVLATLDAYLNRLIADVSAP